MPHYLLRWQLKDATVNALVETPQDRTAALREGVEALGGKLLCYYLALGDFDGMAICEFADAEAVAAFSLMVTSTGTLANVQTTALLTTQQAQVAMERAKKAKAKYTPPPKR